MSKKKKQVIDTTPIVNLLPQETLDKWNYNKARKNSIKIALSAMVIAALGFFVPFGVTVTQNVQLSTLKSQKQSLIVEQGKYKNLVKMQDAISSIKASQAGVATKEVDWKQFINSINDSIPDGTTISAFSYGSTSTDSGSSATNGATAGNGAYNFIVTFMTDNLANLQKTEDSLKKTKGYVSSSFGTVTSSTSSSNPNSVTNGQYQVSATLSYDSTIASSGK